MIDGFKNIIKFNIFVFFSYESGFIKNMSGLFVGQTASLNAIGVIRKFDLD
uniref:Fic family protein n=1 Tax=Helicobacter pylori TaxID=210 RepID=A0A649Z3Y1_HELPX|nr:Fic family protein [Helicobacter pylori]